MGKIALRWLTSHRLEVHPLLFASYPILFLFAHNIDKTAPIELVLPILISISITVFIWLLSGLILRNRKKSGLITALFLFLFFSYGHVYLLVASLHTVRSEVVLHRNMILLFAFIFIFTFFLIKRAKNDIEHITGFFNITGAVLVSLSLISIFYYQAGHAGRSLDIPKEAVIKAEPTKGKIYPNIFYIVLDGYAREDVLAQYYDYDNSEFLGYLREKGFYIATKSTANYPRTGLSITSMLNLNYIQNLLPDADPESKDQTPVQKLTENPQVATFLKKYGYKFVSFSTGYAGTEIKKADRFFAAPGSLTEFQNVLLNTTLLAPFLGPLAKETSFQYEARRKQILWTFEHIPDMSQSKTPVFTFAHILSPHPSFVFGPNGESRNPGHVRSIQNGDGSHYYDVPGNTKATYIKGYREQLHFENKLVKRMIDRILSNSKRPPIIIVQSDHGPGSEFDHWSQDKTNMKERMPILNAFYFPDQDYGQLYESITPVNNLRVVLNQYFQNITLLRDKNYYAAIDKPYKFFDVSDRIEDSSLATRVERELELKLQPWRRQLSKDPEDFQAIKEIAWIYFNGGAFQKALSNFMRASELSPRNVDVVISAGLVNRAMANDSQALEMFNKALEIDPHDSVAKIAKSQLFSDQKKYDEALKLLREVEAEESDAEILETAEKATTEIQTERNKN